MATGTVAPQGDEPAPVLDWLFGTCRFVRWGLFNGRPRLSRELFAAMAFSCVGPLAAGAAAADQSAGAEGTTLVETHLHALERRQADIGMTGGAIEALGDDLLVAARWGAFLVVGTDGAVERLDGDLPMNGPAFRADPYFSDFRHGQFRVADILPTALAPGRWRLFATHHYFVAGDDACVRFRLSATTIRRTAAGYEMPDAWRTVFDAEPCVPSVGFDRGQQAGGRMLTDGAGHLLVVYGDHGMDGRPGRGPDGPDSPPYKSSQLPETHFGKLVRVAIDTGEAEMLASGLRVPQGFARDAEGNLWETEHGPQGGDELNLLTAGANYGWPLVTYGTGYGGRLNYGDPARPGQHHGFAPPVFSWIPSIGISAIAVNDAAAFPLWLDDLLVASLKGTAGTGRSIYRVRRDGRQVRYVERILFDAPIRDLAQTPDGRLALLHDSGRITILRRSDAACAARGSPTVYAVHCANAGQGQQAANR